MLDSITPNDFQGNPLRTFSEESMSKIMKVQSQSIVKLQDYEETEVVVVVVVVDSLCSILGFRSSNARGWGLGLGYYFFLRLPLGD